MAVEENGDLDDMMAMTSNVPSERRHDLFADLGVGEYVVALYDGAVYVGKVEEIDYDDGDCHINFTEKAKQLYRWPKRADKLWVKKDDILCKVHKPQETGKSMRLFKLSDDEMKKVDTLIN